MPFALTEGYILAALDDGQVRAQKGAASLPGEEKRPFRIVAQVVVENAAYTAHLAPMRQVEIRVAGRLEARIVGHARMSVAYILPDTVKVLYVLQKRIVRS